jgi:hypothetical protein
MIVCELLIGSNSKANSVSIGSDDILMIETMKTTASRANPANLTTKTPVKPMVQGETMFLAQEWE